MRQKQQKRQLQSVFCANMFTATTKALTVKNRCDNGGSGGGIGTAKAENDVVDAVVTQYILSHLQHLIDVKVRGS